MTDPRWCTFDVGTLECALPAREIDEVVRHALVTPVPLADPAVRGLAQIRGRVMPVINLRRCFGLPERASGAEPMHLIARTSEGPLSLETDRIHDVIEAAGDALSPAPDTLPAEVRGLITGAWLRTDRIILVLALGQIIARSGGTTSPLRDGGLA